MVLAINVIVILLFIILGIVFWKGKGASLIAGYNTSSAYEKSKINEKALCRCMAKMMFGLAGCWVVLAIGIQMGMMWLFGLGFALFFVVIIICVIYMNTSNRFKKLN